MPSSGVGLWAQIACIWEATARKPGNVHRHADFADTSYLDFLTSAAALAPVLASAGGRPIGATILEAVSATRTVAGSNTNLGIILLLAPLARAALTAKGGEELRPNLVQVLNHLTVDDTCLVYEAIRLANPGGLGTAAQQDISAEPTVRLSEAMALAADRDMIARQYTNGYQEVFQEGVPALHEGLQKTHTLEGAIIHAHLHLMARFPDTLIARKCGQALARESAQRAQAVLDGRARLADLDAWLRTEDNRRNPGTTADLIATSLFVALARGEVALRPDVPWSAGGERMGER